MVQQKLGREQHQRFLKGPIELPSQGMKHLSWCGGIHHKHVGEALGMASHVLHHDLLPHLLHAVKMYFNVAVKLLKEVLQQSDTSSLCMLQSISISICMHLWRSCNLQQVFT